MVFYQYKQQQRLSACDALAKIVAAHFFVSYICAINEVIFITNVCSMVSPLVVLLFELCFRFFWPSGRRPLLCSLPMLLDAPVLVQREPHGKTRMSNPEYFSSSHQRFAMFY